MLPWDQQNVDQIVTWYDLSDRKPRPGLIHFVHVPKAGGSAFTTYARDIVGCTPWGSCCTPEGLPLGSCSENRSCGKVMGCIGHRPKIEALPVRSFASVIVTRDPLARLVSAWFYEDHHEGPNFEYFTLSSNKFLAVTAKMLLNQDEGEWFWTPEHQPTFRHFVVAMNVLERFDVVGVNEMFESSKLLLYFEVQNFTDGSPNDPHRNASRPARELALTFLSADAERSRANVSPEYATFKADLDANKDLQARIRHRHHIDFLLVERAYQLTCTRLLQTPIGVLHADLVLSEVAKVPHFVPACELLRCLLVRHKEAGTLGSVRGVLWSGPGDLAFEDGPCPAPLHGPLQDLSVSTLFLRTWNHRVDLLHRAGISLPRA